MKVASVTLHNFGSFYGVHQVNLSNRGLTFVLGENVDEPKMESNGSGKSTVFDALEWALYGKTPKRDGVNTVVNEEAGSKCWVVVQLQDGQEWWWVYRYRAMPEGNGVKLFRADHEKGVVENLTAMDEPVTTGIVEKVVGMDRKVFHAAVYRRQGDDFDFAEATDGERKKLLARIIPELEECDVLCDRAKERHAVAQAAHSAVMVQVQGVEAALSGYQQTDLGKMEAAWRADRDRRLEAAQVAHQQAASAVQHVQAAVQTLASKQQELSSLVPPVAQTAWRDEFMKRNGLYVEVRLRAEALAERFDAASAILNSFEAMDAGVCSRCHQQVTGAHLAAEVQRQKAELVGLEAQHQAAKAESDRLWAVVPEAEENMQWEQASNDQAASDYGKRRGLLESEIQQLQAVDLAQYHHAADQAAAAVIAIQHEQWQAPDNAMSVKHFEEQLAVLHADAAQKAAVVHHWAWWVAALGNKGVKSYVLDSRIGAMTQAANDWVQALTGGTFWVRFETQAATAKGALSEKFSLRIFRHNPDGTVTERNYPSWSGGEKKRVALGVDRGLSELVARRASRAWSLQIIDESLAKHMDGGGQEAVIELLRSLDLDSVFVIDHNKEVAGEFENYLRVRIQNRRSRFVGEPELALQPDPKAYLPVVA